MTATMPRKIFFISFLISCTGIFSGSFNTSDVKTDISNLKKTIEREKREIEKLQKKLENLKTARVSADELTEGKVIYDLGSGTGKNVILAYLFDPSDPGKALSFVKQNFEDVSAEITDEESEKMIKEKGVPLYGEIRPESFIRVLQNKHLGNNIYKKAIGIELSPTRYKVSEDMRKKLIDEGLEIPGKQIEFQEGNFFDADISDADVVYIACYSDETIETLAKKLSKLKDGLIVATLQSFPEGYGFEEVEELSLPMTWSDGSPVYIYKLDKSKRKTKQ